MLCIIKRWHRCTPWTVSQVLHSLELTRNDRGSCVKNKKRAWERSWKWSNTIRPIPLSKRCEARRFQMLLDNLTNTWFEVGVPLSWTWVLQVISSINLTYLLFCLDLGKTTRSKTTQTIPSSNFLKLKCYNKTVPHLISHSWCNTFQQTSHR